MEQFTVTALSPKIFRIRLRRNKRQRESMLTRYGIIKESLGQDTSNCALPTIQAGILRLHTAQYDLSIDLNASLQEACEECGFSIAVTLTPSDRLFGLGDENRETLMKRGRVCDLWQTNVTCYGPIPYVMCSAGWGILINSTYRHRYDLGACDPDILRIESQKGMLDFYVMLGARMTETLDLYTQISGRPVMLPKAAYGLTFVCNEEEGARDLLENCLHFRREKIPCDIMGLEPGWMSKHYDFSLEKKWDEGRFYLPYWLPENYSGPWSFFYNLRQMGFLLSLWLCCDYDLLWEEDRRTRVEARASFEDAAIRDTHFVTGMLMDKITKPEEPWFEHLKKFVDNGASAFKLDGANQIIEHKDRLYAGQYLDDEVHNIYPVLYGKQMMRGFSDYTGRRALIYTCGLYAGQQQYCATWAGDTGGGPKTMVSILNLAMCGHANASCDMDASSVESIHYCSLMPWTQHLGWRNWQHPWFLGDELEGVYGDYARLRSSLFPYLYATAHQAAASGLPIARPLSLMWPEEPKYDAALNEYMLGDSLLVAAFDLRLTLPAGGWTDYFTGRRYPGDSELDYEPPLGKGGALFVRDGGIVVTQDWMPHITHHAPNVLYAHVYPGCDGEFTLWEDDGETYAYQEGAVAKTRFAMEHSTPQGFDFVLSAREGSFSNMPDACPIQVVVHNAEHASADGASHDPEARTLSFVIPRALRSRGFRVHVAL